FGRDTGICLDFLLHEQVLERAAHAFVAHAQRRRQSRAGSPKRLLVDFIVAAHAMLRADRLMTLDASRYRRIFRSCASYEWDLDFNTSAAARLVCCAESPAYGSSSNFPVVFLPSKSRCACGASAKG